MSVSTFLHIEALEHAKQDLTNYEGKLKQMVEMDIEKAKAECRLVVAHFVAEVARIRGLIDTRVLAHLDEGQHPQVAVQKAEAGEPTRVETAARILADQQAVNQEAEDPHAEDELAEHAQILADEDAQILADEASAANRG